VSTPLHSPTPLEVSERAACMCDHGDVCSSFAPGHHLHLIQARLASATPLDWADGLVVRSDAAAGTVTLRTLGGELLTVWSAAGAALEVEPGEPVAFHRRYHVLAVGRTQFNVAPR